MPRSHSKRPLSESWEVFLQRYRDYRSRPVWGAWTIVPNQRIRIAKTNLGRILERGERAATKLDAAIAVVREKYKHPSDVGPIRFAAIMRGKTLVGAELLRVFREAIVFDRDAYACRYCGRKECDVWEVEKHCRTLRLVVDHARPVSQRGVSDDLRNGVTACWSCNVMKGPLPAIAFLRELKSLAKAVVAGNVRAVGRSL